MGNAEEICKSVLLLTSPETMRGFQSLFMFSPRVQRKQSVREKAIGTDRDVVINPAERLCHTADYVRGSRLAVRDGWVSTPHDGRPESDHQKAISKSLDQDTRMRQAPKKDRHSSVSPTPTHALTGQRPRHRSNIKRKVTEMRNPRLRLGRSETADNRCPADVAYAA